MIRRLVYFFCWITLLNGSPSRADDISIALNGLTQELATSIEASGIKRVSVVDFTDLQNRGSDFGRFVAERLSMALVNSGKGFVVMDRAHVKTILNEHKLTFSGLVDPKAAREFGHFAGVDAIVFGNVVSLGDRLFINAKAISIETTQILAAKEIEIRRTGDIAALLTTNTPEPEANLDAVPEPAHPTQQKNFTAPESVAVFGNMEYELVSFKVAPQTVILLLRVKNRSKSDIVHLALNRDVRDLRSQLIDDNGGTIGLGYNGFSGISASDHIYGSAQTAFESLRIGVARNDTQVFQDMGSFTEVNPGESSLITLQFSLPSSSGQLHSGGAAAGRGPYHLQTEFIAAQASGPRQVKVNLNNLVLRNIVPR